MIPGLIIYLLTLALDIITDYRLWAKHKSPNHTRGFLLRILPLGVALWLMGWWSLGLLFTYWMLMDSIFGLLIARTPLYVGTTARLDRLQRVNPWIMVLKFVLGIAGAVVYILSVTHHWK